MAKDKKLFWIMGIIAVIAIFYLSPTGDLFAVITPGTVDDGFTLLSDGDLPFSDSAVSGVHTTDRFDFPRECSQASRSVNEVCHKCGWSDATCRSLGPSYGDIGCGGTKYWSTLGSSYGTCYAVCDTTSPIICAEDKSGSLTTTFTVPEDYREVWLNVNTNLPYSVVSPSNIDCKLNGNTLTATFKEGSTTRWYVKYVDISDKVIIGENTITCSYTSAQTTDMIDLDVAVYGNSAPCMEYYSDNCFNQPSDLPRNGGGDLGNCGQYAHLTSKKCDYDLWEAKTSDNYNWPASYSSSGMAYVKLEGHETQFKLTSSLAYAGTIGANYIQTKEGLGGKKFRADIKFAPSNDRDYDCPTMGFSISVGGQGVYSKSIDACSAQIDEGLLEIVPSFLNPNNVIVNFKGQKEAEITLSSSEDSKISFSLSGHTAGASPSSYIQVTNARYQLPFDCKIEDGDLLAMESFTGGQEISQYSFRYPVKSFCPEHPVIVTSSSGSGSTTTAEPYIKWIEGQTLFIPEDQTWTSFYIFHNPGTIPIICEDEFFDVATGTCTQVSGIVMICSEGQFDPESGMCVVQPESVCAEGYFDTSLGMCVYHPPVQFICPEGDYNEATGKCEYFPSEEIICVEPFTYNEVTDVCDYVPEESTLCPSNSEYNSETDKCEYSPDVEIGGICSTGYTFNPLTMLCEFVPEHQIICPTGTAYSAIEDACVGEGRIVDTITPEEMCKELSGTFDSLTSSCTFEESGENYCIQQGFDYDPLSDSCTYVEQVVSKDVDGKVIKKPTSPWIWLGVVLILLYLFFESGSKRGFIKK